MATIHHLHLGYYRQLTGHELDPRTIITAAERRQQPRRLALHRVCRNRETFRNGHAAQRHFHPWSPCRIRHSSRPPAGKLGIEHDPLYLVGADQPSPGSGSDPGCQFTNEKLGYRRTPLRELDQSRRELEQFL